MPSTPNEHELLKTLLAERKWEEAQALWLDLAEQRPDEADFLLLLVKEFADAGQAALAAELVSLIAPGLKSAGKDHEWLFALKLQANAPTVEKSVRAELGEAYQRIYAADNRLRPILAIADFEQARTPLPAAIAKADTLLALNVGGFCQHKSWGVGRVKTFDATLNRIVVAFPHNPDHAMQLAYAAESLTPINADHIEVRKLNDLAGLKQLAGNDPVALVRLVLVNCHHSVTPDRLESILAGSVVAPADWKKWWDNAKKLLKRDPHFEVPARKTDPILLRSAPVAQQDEMLQAFRAAPSLTQKTDVARQFLKIVDDIDDPELLLQEFQDGLHAALKKTKSDYQAERLEAAFLIDDLRRHQKPPAESTGALVADILARIENLPELLDSLTAAAQKRTVAALQATNPDRLSKTINYFSAKILDEMADLLPAQANRIAQLIQNQTGSPELLYWVCKNRHSQKWLQPLRSPILFQAILCALETGTPKTTKRLRDHVFSDETLLPDLLADAPTDTVRDIARQLLGSPAFEELDRRSLMARLVKEFPFVQEYLITKTVREQPLVVSWASLHKRRAELDEIITKRIPENSKEIGVARSYGDLRENFEFKAAKELQKVLMRRRAELEVLLARAQGSDFADARTDVVSIGTTVTITDLATGQPQTYHILGAWDSDTARGIISYPAALAQTLLNKRVGDEVEANGESGKLQYRIDRIEKVPAEILQSL